MAKKPTQSNSAASPKKNQPPSGIFKLEMRDPATLADCRNELNWRKHPQRQRQAFQALKSQVGYADAIILNVATGHLIDGHMRLDEAIRMKEKEIPVLLGNWSEEQENLLLEKKDLLTSMAETNSAALTNLIALNQKTIDKIKTDSKNSKLPPAKDVLTKLNKDISHYAQGIVDGSAPRVLLERKPREWKDRVEEEAREEEKYEGIKETVFKDDVIFPSEFPWGIPPLLPDLLCDTPPTGTWNRQDNLSPEELGGLLYCYSAGPSTFPSPEKRSGGYLGFFTEDFRFTRAWDDSPDFTKELLAQDWSGVLLPDYSQYGDWPGAVNLHNLYRSRWCGRYWQEAGIRVIPIIQDMGDISSYHDLVLGTLPESTPMVAFQCRTGGESADYWPHLGEVVSLTLRYLEDLEHIIVYGGVENRKYLEGHLPTRKKLRYTFLESFLSRSRKKKRE